MGLTQDLHSISGSRTGGLAFVTGIWSVPTVAAPATITPAEAIKVRGYGLSAHDGAGAFGVTQSMTGAPPADPTMSLTFTIEEAWGPLAFASCQCTQGTGAAAGLDSIQQGIGTLDRSLNPLVLASAPGGTIRFNIMGADTTPTWVAETASGLQISVVLIFENLFQT